jgi:4,5:9,10-diseco-3-hydroxy-5,9,17-trioxoandrosta-1(10),2-diene-4-oate hydrolase
MKECVYDPSILTDDWIDRAYRMASLPSAHKVFLNTLRSCVDFDGLSKKLLGTFLDNLSQITVPVLVIWGQQDNILPVAHAYTAVQRIPNADLHVFDPCGHLPQIECPEEFNTRVLAFLKG